MTVALAATVLCFDAGAQQPPDITNTRGYHLNRALSTVYISQGEFDAAIAEYDLIDPQIVFLLAVT